MVINSILKSISSVLRRNTILLEINDILLEAEASVTLLITIIEWFILFVTVSYNFETIFELFSQPTGSKKLSLKNIKNTIFSFLMEKFNNWKGRLFNKVKLFWERNNCWLIAFRDFKDILYNPNTTFKEKLHAFWNMLCVFYFYASLIKSLLNDALVLITSFIWFKWWIKFLKDDALYVLFWFFLAIFGLIFGFILRCMREEDRRVLYLLIRKICWYLLEYYWMFISIWKIIFFNSIFEYLKKSRRKISLDSNNNYIGPVP